MSAGTLGCFGNWTCSGNVLLSGAAVGAALRRRFGSLRLGLKICVLSEGGDEILEAAAVLAGADAGLVATSAFAEGGTVLIAASILSASVDLGLTGASILAGDGTGLVATVAPCGGATTLPGVSALGNGFSNGLGEALSDEFSNALGETFGGDFAAGRGGGGTSGRLTVPGSINVPTPMTPTRE
jgi:hypothetical protein